MWTAIAFFRDGTRHPLIEDHVGKVVVGVGSTEEPYGMTEEELAPALRRARSEHDIRWFQVQPVTDESEVGAA